VSEWWLGHSNWRGIFHAHTTSTGLQLALTRLRWALMSPAFRRPVLLSFPPGGSCDRAVAGHRHPPSRVPARQHARSAAGRPLPLARPVPVPAAPEDVVYGIGRIDASGRIADRAVISALGWRGGDRLTLTADAGVVTARRDPGGMITLPARAYITVPAALRRRCGLHSGDRVLLAALLHEDTLTAYSLAVVDQAIRAHGAHPNTQGETP
jgi:hypothetical protein